MVVLLDFTHDGVKESFEQLRGAKMLAKVVVMYRLHSNKCCIGDWLMWNGV
jgi:hypothetical protein